MNPTKENYLFLQLAHLEFQFDDTFYKYLGDNLVKVGQETEYIPNTSTYGNREIGGTVCPGILANSFALTL